MVESSDSHAAPRAAQADLDAALRDRVEVQITPILAEVMAALRAGGLPAGQLLWRAIGIVNAAMASIQRRARGTAGRDRMIWRRRRRCRVSVASPHGWLLLRDHKRTTSVFEERGTPHVPVHTLDSYLSVLASWDSSGSYSFMNPKGKKRPARL